MKDAFRKVNLVIASSQELARAIAANAEDPNDAPPEDRAQMLAMWRALFHAWSNAHRQHLNGTWDPALYEAVIQEISMLSGNASETEAVENAERRARHLRWAWESERFIFNLDFQEFVDANLGIER